MYLQSLKLSVLLVMLSAVSHVSLGAADEVTLASLIDKASSAGTVRVLVRLNLPDRMEAFMSQQQISERRQALSNLREDLINNLFVTSSLRPDQINRSFRVSPVVALEATPDVLDALSRDPRVAGIEEDEIRWVNLEQSTELIGANTGWPRFLGGAMQAVAVLDTGVDSSHPALSETVVAEACFSTNGQSADVTVTSLCPGGVTESTAVGSGANCDVGTIGDSCSHGTHVAGIVASKGAAVPELQGVAPKASIIAVQVFSSLQDLTVEGSVCGGPNSCVGAYDSDIIAGLEFVFSLRNTLSIAAVNMSLGSGLYNAVCDESPYKSIIDQLREAGTATVVSSGNNGADGSTSFPSCISSVVTVGSSTKTDLLSSFSNVAPWVDLLAPGSNICSTMATGATSNCGPNFSVLSGTSMAAPHVAGAFAVLRSLFPTATVSELEERLKLTGIPIQTYLGGIPRIQVEVALALAAYSAPTPPLANISTRGQVGTGDEVLIGGFITGDNGATVVVRARGPSLADAGVPGTLSDPNLTLYSGQTPIASNDDWQDDPSSALLLESGLAPTRDSEAALLINLAPGPYTVIVRGAGLSTGIGIVEVYELGYFGEFPQP